MTALPVSASESAVRAAVGRLSAIQPGAYQVVSCYLKLEPRDKAGAKYLIKIKNRIKQVAADLERRPLDHAQRESVAGDLDGLRRYFEEPSRLPAARGVALFVSGALDLFEVLPLPHVHRSRLAVAPARGSSRSRPTTSPSCPVSRRWPRAPGSFMASARRRRAACSRAASASTIITCASGRRSSDTTPGWRTASSRSKPSARSPGSWPRASAWTRRRCCRTSIPTSTTSCSASCA